MILPEDAGIYAHNVDKLIFKWKDKAIALSIEYGIYISVEIDYSSYIDKHGEYITEYKRIFFKSNGHEFESLRALRKALRNKVFM